jgi:tetratricopeptide (TPR) repeat protein
MSDQNRTGFIVISILGATAALLVVLILRDWNRPAPRSGSTASRSEPSGKSPAGGEPGIQWRPAHVPVPAAERLKGSSNRAAQHLNEEGLALYAKGDFESAAARFREALARDPSEPALVKNLAYARGSQGWKLIESEKWLEALKALKEASSLLPDEAGFYLGLGLIHHHLKEEETALDMLKQAVARRSDDPQPYLLMAEIYYNRDELDLAVGYYEKAAELEPRNAVLKDRLEKARRERDAQTSFSRSSTLHFTVKFEGHEEAEAAREILDLLENAYQEVGRALSIYPQAPVNVILYSEEEFRDVTMTPSWSKAIFDGKIRIPIEGIEEDPELLRKVVNHEYTHALIFELNRSRIPTWLNEGLALNMEGTGPNRWTEILRDNINRGRPPIPLRSLQGSFLSFSGDRAGLAYAESYSATAYLIDRFGLSRIRDLLSALADNPDFDKAFSDQFMISYDEFETQWRSGI